MRAEDTISPDLLTELDQRLPRRRAVLIGFPLFVYRQLMTIPALQQHGLAFAVTLVAVSLFAFSYGLWVLLLGPNVFMRLASATRAWQDFQRRSSHSKLNNVDVSSTDGTDGESRRMGPEDSVL